MIDQGLVSVDPLFVRLTTVKIRENLRLVGAAAAGIIRTLEEEDTVGLIGKEKINPY